MPSRRNRNRLGYDHDMTHEYTSMYVWEYHTKRGQYKVILVLHLDM